MAVSGKTGNEEILSYPFLPYQDVEKVLPWTFLTPEPENAISRFLHFQWLTATENGGISLYRTQAVEKLRFSTACYVLCEPGIWFLFLSENKVSFASPERWQSG
ncbi:hypothetical protein [Thiolapillus sp.]